MALLQDDGEASGQAAAPGLMATATSSSASFEAATKDLLLAELAEWLEAGRGLRVWITGSRASGSSSSDKAACTKKDSACHRAA